MDCSSRNLCQMPVHIQTQHEPGTADLWLYWFPPVALLSITTVQILCSATTDIEMLLLLWIALNINNANEK